ncbi:MAG TPA: FMN-binding protein, partial [Patescibacteria group bacterium]|nr:FMN-binding protein [Patescibacteria group bacterium]
MITKVKKYILSFLVIISSAVYVVLGRQNSPAASFKSAPSPNTGTSASTNQNYKDGQYTGSVADAYYGNIQVKAIVQNGKISDVVFLDYPQDRQTSLRIN